MLEVIFIRHGESAANRQNMIVSQQSDPGLTEQGWAQAQHAAAVWGHTPITAVYASPLRRTQETASAFGQPVIVDERLHEIALGRWDGMVIADIEAADHERYHQWKRDPELGAPDGGEALSAVAARIESFLDDIRARHQDGRIIAATHSDCMKAVILSTLHAPWTSAQFFHLTNTAGVAVQWRDSSWQCMAYPVMPPQHG